MVSMSRASQIDTAIFTTLQSKIDEESEVRESLKTIVEALSKQGRLTQSILARIHNCPTPELQQHVLTPAAQAVQEQVTTVKRLSEVASQYPFYKWNGMWLRDVQNLISSLQLYAWLSEGRLVTIEEVGTQFGGELASIDIPRPC